MAWFGVKTRVIFGVSFVLLAGACGGSKSDAKSPSSSSGSSDSHSGPAEIGKPAPDLSIQTLNGKGSVSLSSLSGKIAIIDFWATWCGPCKVSLPKLDEISRKWPGKVEVVGVSVDDEQTGVADFAKSNGVTFPIGWDDGHAIANRWKVEKMPTSFIIDGSGTVRYIHASYHDDEPEQINKELIALMDEPSGGSSSVASGDSKTEDKPADKASDTSADKGGDKSAESGGGEDSSATADTAPPPEPVKKPKGKGHKKPKKKKKKK
jgi:thiol-disulfide isomerase/thioredoxin